MSLDKFLEGELLSKMNYTFQFWEILPNCLLYCINLYFHQQRMRMHAFLTPHWHIVSVIFFFNYRNRIGMLHSWVSICISEDEIFPHMHVIFPILHWTLVFSQLIHMDAGHVKNMNSLTVKGIIIFSSFIFCL